MKAIFELPDALIDEAKAVSAREGLPLGEFVAQAIQLKLSTTSEPVAAPWMRHFGSLGHLHEETGLIESIINAEFETVDPEQWR
jgi:hypothetical protein